MSMARWCSQPTGTQSHNFPDRRVLSLPVYACWLTRVCRCDQYPASVEILTQAVASEGHLSPLGGEIQLWLALALQVPRPHSCQPRAAPAACI